MSLRLLDGGWVSQAFHNLRSAGDLTKVRNYRKCKKNVFSGKLADEPEATGWWVGGLSQAFHNLGKSNWSAHSRAANLVIERGSLVKEKGQTI